MTEFAGIFPIVNTTFHDDGTLDLESQRRLVRFLIEAGAHGLGLFGNASEGYALAEDERRLLTRVILEEVGGVMPVIVSSGHTGTDVAVALSRRGGGRGRGRADDHAAAFSEAGRRRGLCTTSRRSRRRCGSRSWCRTRR